MGSFLVIGLTFVAGFLFVYGANLIVTDLFLRDQEELRRRMQEETRLRQQEAARNSPLLLRSLSELAEEAAEEIAGDSRSLRDRLRELTEQSGLDLAPDRLLTICAFVGGLFAFLAGLAAKSLILALAAGLLGIAAPVLYVQMKRRKRQEALRSQLPESFDMMARGLRAGQTVTQAMHSVAHETKPPIAVEFGYCYEQQNLGLSPEVALRDLGRRTGLLEIKVFVLALLVQRQTGGSMTELLEKLATIVRDRYRMRSKVKGLTAEGRLQAFVLVALPFLVYGMMLVTNRPYALKLFDHPVLPVGCLVSMTIGALWIRKIVNFET
jgi:tight adherence protein B